MKIVVDAMGGDFAPEEVVAGAVAAADEYGIQVVLVGQEERIRQELAGYKPDPAQVTVVHAPEVIEMGEPPAIALRKKKNSSIMVATQLVKEGLGDAVVSAGNTGAAMGAALLGLGRIKGIDRPAIAGVIPTLRGFALLLDVGANSVCEPRNLQQFALMGNIYSSKIFGVQKPKVGLLNIGEEETKGNPLYLEAYKMIKNSDLHFIGNVEGRDITGGGADVIVCDGFVGNVVLKFGEGLARDLMTMIKDELRKNLLAKAGAAILLTQTKNFRKRIDYSERGGAPLLGVNGICIIGHGSSRAKAVKNAISVAKECVEVDMVRLIKDSVHGNPTGVD